MAEVYHTVRGTVACKLLLSRMLECNLEEHCGTHQNIQCNPAMVSYSVVKFFLKGDLNYPRIDYVTLRQDEGSVVRVLLLFAPNNLDALAKLEVGPCMAYNVRDDMEGIYETGGDYELKFRRPILRGSESFPRNVNAFIVCFHHDNNTCTASEFEQRVLHRLFYYGLTPSDDVDELEVLKQDSKDKNSKDRNSKHYTVVRSISVRDAIGLGAWTVMVNTDCWNSTVAVRHIFEGVWNCCFLLREGGKDTVTQWEATKLRNVQVSTNSTNSITSKSNSNNKDEKRQRRRYYH